MYYIIHAITLERFHIVAHSFAASFSIKTSFMKLTSYFISKTKQIYAKTLTILESTFKMRAKLPWMFFEILTMSAVICKERFLHKNEIVQYLQNYRYKDVDQVYFRKPLQAFTNSM